MRGLDRHEQVCGSPARAGIDPGLPLTEAERKFVRLATARGPESRQAWSDHRERRAQRRKRERRAKQKVQRRAKAVLMRKRRAAGGKR